MINDSLSLISLNIENSKHIEKVRDFLLAQNADVICLQEVLESTYNSYKDALKMNGLFCAMTMRKRDDNGIVEKEGVAIMSKYHLINTNTHCYRGDIKSLKYWDKSSLTALMETVYAVLAKCEILFQDKVITLITTHFTWSPDGKPNDYQKRDIKALLKYLEQYSSFILTGDLNAPRGGEIFAELESRYHDNIPKHYDSSIDPDLHKVKNLKLMIDGLFSTPDYLIEDVSLENGVSDHSAVLAKIIV